MRVLLSLILILTAWAGYSEAKVTDLFSSDKADTWYVQASLYEQDGDYEEAAKLLESVLENVDDEYIYLKLANIYGELKDSEMLKFTLERGVRKMPSSAVLLGALADFYRADEKTVKDSFPLYQKAYKISGDKSYAEGEAIARAAMKDYNGAINIYTNLIKDDPKSDFYVQRARFYEKLGLENESVNDYLKATEIDNNFMAAARLADYYLGKGDNDNAIKYLRMVIEVSPELTIAKFKLAEILRKMGRSDEATAYYEEIIDNLNETEKMYVLKQLGALYFQNQNFEKAKKYFTKAYELTPDIQTGYSLALIAETTGDRKGAEEWYGRILKERPDFTEATKRLAILMLKDKKPEKALELINGVAADLRDVDFARIEGQIYVDMGKIDKAVEVLSDAVKANPAEVKLYIDLALAIEKNKDRQGAEDAVKKGLKQFPNDPSLLNFLGYMYAEQGKNLKEAQKMIKRALDQKPDEPAYLDSMAWVLYQQGMFKEALPFQKRALKGAPDEDEIRGHMKAILDKLGIRKSPDDIIKED